MVWLQNICKLVIVHPEALCEDLGWHNVALLGHDAEDYHHGKQNLVKSLSVALPVIREQPPVIFWSLANLR
jgi:hypothetical protein